MAEALRIKPDLDFVRAIRASGGDTVKHCMQCANCSVACEVSPDDNPFPRKEMLLAQWGQKETLLHDPDIWLCFGCTDCSVQCPRGASPGDVLAAVRKEAIRRYSPMGFIQTALSHPRYLPFLIAVPVVIWGVIYALFARPGSHETSYFDGIFPPGVLEPVLGAMTTIGCLILFIGGLRYWKALARLHPRPAGKGKAFIPAAIATGLEILSHKRFRQCETDGGRTLGHMLMLFGFALIFLGGTAVGMGVLFFNLPLPLDLLNPMKLALNIGAGLLIVGSGMLIQARLTRPERLTRGGWFDWFFLIALFGTALTGILTEVMRLIDIEAIAFPVYFVHLVFVFCLLGYAPWSKIAHLVYRSVALLHAHHTGRLQD